MHTTLYYFSGTGNSLKVAQDIAERLGDTDIIPIRDDIPGEIESDLIGFIFPVYAFGLPLIVTRYMENMTVKNKAAYVFAIATCRMEKGGALYQAANLLKEKGLTLSASFAVILPGNYIYAYPSDTKKLEEEKFHIWSKRLDTIIATIRNREWHEEPLTFKERYIQYPIMYRMVSSQFAGWDARFWTEDTCNGCGICEKVCPVGNIVIQGNRPIWQHRCEQCFACINWCPKASIQCKKKTLGRARYHHPAISVKDLL